ncbi:MULTISPECIES: hypothetical protein [Rhodopseudomonas]|uniref:Signal peptide protein n=1 Tax=Rhodopseudomonas palustris TaxID=1076 RepID=A0A0D7F3X3_RHOPL|nr:MULTISPECIES: hypothetical protein [Rhodopseudomonas]KIZ47516.1 signal peptide protein [Rhodopseudomonas palustris]MDF3811709.1 hypothetical protein [Rhodopseudomonas sp. BAL398]WOK17903.1 hypothetical protein RBJ75_27980 [Rhodopseudomonas sp. BAL398]
MKIIKLLTAVAMLSAAITAPALARTKHASGAHHRGHHRYYDPSLYLHNYGPPVWPDAVFSYYDGPLSRRCKQGAAAYRGQDGRPHPCH